MARRADWDNDDDGFEVLNEPSSINTPEKFEFIEDDSFEVVPSKTQPPLLVNSNPIAPITIIEKPVPVPINIGKPLVNEAQQSPENSPPSSTNSLQFPIRYGSAARIPYNESFDLTSLLTRKSYQSNQTNDLLDILQNNKSKTHFSNENNLQQILLDNDHHRQNLVQIAKQAQQDFLNAIQLD